MLLDWRGFFLGLDPEIPLNTLSFAGPVSPVEQSVLNRNIIRCLRCGKEPARK